MNWIKIFRAGTHTDSSGKTATFTAEDLDKVVAGFDPAQRQVPLVLGHPKDNDPAFGWVEGLRRAGEFLEATFKQVPEALAKAVAEGRYKQVSISLRPDLTLRHVGLLGAVPPAVPGLGEVVGFADGAAVYAFNEQGEEEGMELERLKKQVEQLQAENAQLKAGGAYQEQLAAKDKEITDLQAKNKAAEAAKVKAEADFAEHKAGQRKLARQARLDKLVAEGKILPAEQANALAFAEALAGAQGEMEFADGSGKTEKVSKEEAYWRGFEQRQSHGLFKEYTAPGASVQESGTPNLAAKF
ncbi:MAG: hypothetical protein AB7E47_05845 [Desulfovibrionaceae bacterium]